MSKCTRFVTAIVPLAHVTRKLLEFAQLRHLFFHSVRRCVIRLGLVLNLGRVRATSETIDPNLSPPNLNSSNPHTQALNGYSSIKNRLCQLAQSSNVMSFDSLPANTWTSQGQNSVEPPLSTIEKAVALGRRTGVSVPQIFGGLWNLVST